MSNTGQRHRNLPSTPTNSSQKQEIPTIIDQPQMKNKKRMLYFPMDYGELTIDGLIVTGALRSALSEADVRKS